MARKIPTLVGPLDNSEGQVLVYTDTVIPEKGADAQEYTFYHIVPSRDANVPQLTALLAGIAALCDGDKPYSAVEIRDMLNGVLSAKAAAKVKGDWIAANKAADDDAKVDAMIRRAEFAKEAREKRDKERAALQAVSLTPNTSETHKVTPNGGAASGNVPAPEDKQKKTA